LPVAEKKPTAPAPARRKPKPAAKPSSNGQPADSGRAAKIVAFVEENPGCASGPIVDLLGVSRPTFRRELLQLLESGQLRKEGKLAGTRYFPAGEGSDRPSEAPADTQEPSAPTTPIPLRSNPGTDTRNHEAAAAHKEKRSAADGIVLELLEQTVRPMAKHDPMAAVQARVEVSKAGLNQVLMRLQGAKRITRIEREDAPYFVAGSTITQVDGGGEGPRTEVEKRVYAAVAAAPLTSSEISLKLDPPIQRTTVTTVLEGMARRGIVDRSTTGQIATFARLAERAERSEAPK
jgi:hypothetical protein